MGIGLGRTATALAILVGCCSVIVAAQTLVFSVEDSTSVEDPIETQTISWTAGNQTSRTIASNSDHTAYLLELHLIEYGGETGQSAVSLAQQDGDADSNYINAFTITNSSKAVAEDIRRDLMTDGVAHYFNVPRSSDGTLTLTVVADDSGTVTIDRTPVIADHRSIKIHRTVATENCGDCHTNASGPQVHWDMGATARTATDWQTGRCAECHGNSMTDLHQDCDTACHYEGYPIVSNGTAHSPIGSDPDMIQGEFWCAPGCHNQAKDGPPTLGAVHINEYMDSGTFCGKCHDDDSGGTLVAYQHTRPGFQLPATYDGDCAKCHGVGFDPVHSPARDNMRINKRSCGSGMGSCH